jgi:hypothetical protein
VKVTAFRSRQNDFEQFFVTQGELSACKNVEGLMAAAMNIRYNPEEWRLFTDSPTHSLKAVLLHKGNVLPSIPVACAIHKQETYKHMKEILSCMNYRTYKWHICGDFKVTAILMGLRKDDTKFCYFLCESDSHAKSVQYSKKNWPLHKSHTPGTKNVAHQLLVDPCKVLLPPLHIKLGFMKNLLKALDRNGPAFSLLCEKFPRLSTEKIKTGVFIGTQIRQLFRNPPCDLVLSDDEKAGWNAFPNVATGFLGNLKVRQLQEACGESYNFLREAWLQHVTQDAFPPFTLGFLSG